MSGLDTPIGSGSFVLLIHPHLPAGEKLARKLNERGFSTDLTASITTARVVARSRYYRTIVLITDLWRGAGMMDLTDLRAARPRTWVVVASPNPPPDELASSLRYLADALLIGPLYVDDLAARLLAFSIRPRPP